MQDFNLVEQYLISKGIFKVGCKEELESAPLQRAFDLPTSIEFGANSRIQ